MKKTSKASSRGTKKTVANKPTSLPTVDSDSRVSIRKIDNGFIVTESGTTGRGKNKTWYEKEKFSPVNPLKEVKVKFGGK